MSWIPHKHPCCISQDRDDTNRAIFPYGVLVSVSKGLLLNCMGLFSVLKDANKRDKHCYKI